jgi:hypothetical protein
MEILRTTTSTRPSLFSRVSRLPGAWFALILLAAAPRLSALNETVFEDIFGRRINENGLTLVDWEGQIANPAIKILVRPPSDAIFPGTAAFSSTEPRIYFDQLATGTVTATAAGPTKNIFFTDSTPIALYVSIFPDHDGASEDHTISMTFTPRTGAARTQTLAVHVIDQDQPSRALDYNFAVDFSQDKTGFFDDAAKKAIVTAAAQDWAYFFNGTALDQVAAGAEKTFIWNPDGFINGTTVTNATAYRGFQLYAYGISAAGPIFRSGGEPSSSGGFQTQSGVALPLRRSGGMEVEIKGNYSLLGWFLSTSDSDWWQGTNSTIAPADLLSIVHHEMGHSFIFNAGHTRFSTFKTAGSINDPAVVAYLGRAPIIDASDHLDGSLDRLSLKGAFGYEYYGSMPARRWIITKLDLLVAQACGYTLRETSAFVPAQITTTFLASGIVNASYSQTVAARGGVPFYNWTVKSGSLPPGLALNSFTGVISGQPTATGTYAFSLQVADYDTQATPAESPFTIRVDAVTTNPGRLVNLSVLAPLTAAGDTFSLGYVVSGATASNPKPLVVRAAGPSLGALGYPGVLDDPKLELFAGSTKTQENDDWGGLATTTSAMAGVGAFAYSSATSLDAAIAMNTTSRDNSVKISAGAHTANGTGAVIAEVYDATPGSSYNSATTPRLINFSIIKNVGASVTLGFVIGGATSETVLIRAVGPALGIAPFNIGGVMADPQVELFDAAGKSLATSDNWGGTAALIAAFDGTGAFRLPVTSKDAALVITLAPGNYTIAVTPVTGTSGGIALLEVYDVP